jgi:hypothetical protein
MAKHFVILISFQMVLMLFVGCKTEPIKQPQAQPQKTEVLKSEPAKVKPPEIKPPTPKPNETVPLEAKPAKKEPNEAKPSEPEQPKAESKSPSKTVEPNEVKPITKVSFHDKCAVILKEFVNDKGMVNYNELRRKRYELSKLLEEFAKFDPNEYKSWPKEDKIAFWINAYNIKMLKVIADNYPIESTPMLRILWGPYSTRHIDKNIGGIWKSKFIVMGEEFTLLEIDERFFRKELDEPRAFLAITNASVSSPPLNNEPYYGYRLNEQLDKQCKKFLSSPGAFRIDRENNIVYLSAILKPSWYGQYFLKKYGTDKKFKDEEPAVGAVLNFITNYVPESDTSFLELKNYTVEYLNYDWTINNGS